MVSRKTGVNVPCSLRVVVTSHFLCLKASHRFHLHSRERDYTRVKMPENRIVRYHVRVYLFLTSSANS